MHLFGLPTAYQNYTEGEGEEEKRQRRVYTRVCMCTAGVNPGNRRESQPVKDGADARAVSAAPVDVQACGQQDAILDRNRAVGEGGNQQFIPPCEHREETCGDSNRIPTSWIAVRCTAYIPGHESRKENPGRLRPSPR